MKILDFKQKIILSFVLFGIISFSIGSIVIYQINKTNNIDQFTSKAYPKANEREDFFKNFIKTHTHYTKSISSSSVFLDALYDDNKKLLNCIVKARVDSLDSILQIRLVDSEGNELVKSVRDSNNEIKVAQKEHMVNIADRYYFKDAIGLNDGDIYYSKIDLAYEDCITDKANIPSLRIAMPVEKGAKKVLLIVNIDMQKVLKELSKTTLYNIYLVDKDGYYILHEANYYDNKNHNYSRYNDKHNLKDDFEEASDILKNDQYYGHMYYSQKIDFDNPDSITMVLQIKSFILDKQLESLKSELLIGLFIALILSLPFAYALSHVVEKMRNRLQKEIVELNATLEDRVKEEVEKNNQKERMLLQQSKLAIMGEMISMIAHQWRQPLAGLKVMVQAIKFKKDIGKLTDEYLYESVKDSSALIDHLSKTIDDFRDFFKPNKAKETTDLKSVLKESFDFLSHSFKVNSITIEEDCHIDTKITIYKRELLQVFMNILNNAKDALIENNPTDNRVVKIHGHEDEKSLTISIEDNAGGIPEDIIEKIFEPYFSTKSENGTGLGLYMSKVIVDTHLGGLLSVENVENGAKFSILIPKD
jgi:signal transduction histidine kinase